MTRKPNENNANDSMFPEDDPRITAYALGELSTEEATNLESELSSNPEWQETIASVKETAGLLKQALAGEPMVGLTQAHRDRIEWKIAETEESGTAPAQPLTPGQRIAWVGVGIAASLFLLFSVAMPVLTEHAKPPQLTARGTVQFDSRHPHDSAPTNLIEIAQSGPAEEMIDEVRSGTADGNTITFEVFDGQQSWRDFLDASGVVAIGYDDVNSYSHGTNYLVVQNSRPPTADNSGIALWGLNRTIETGEHFDFSQDGPTQDPNVSYGFQFPYAINRSVDSEVAFDAVYFDNLDGKNPGGYVLVASENRDAITANGLDVFFGDGYASFHRTPIEDVDIPGIYMLSVTEIAGFDNLTNDCLVVTGSSEDLAKVEDRIKAGWFHYDVDGDGIPDAISPRESSTERYAHIRENPFKSVTREPLSTFSIDVDTASYANARRILNSGQLPPRDAVRIEEFINYFAYDYPQPSIDEPFSINVDVADCPWNRNHRLARIGLQGYEIPNDERPESNLVFLIDVSGSMNQPNKLPLLKQSMTMLVDQLDEYDRVAIVVYAGASGLVLDSITCDNRGAILDAINNLQPGGGTNGAAGIELAYEIAADNFIKNGTNRVILATDGDFNVGVTSEDDLHRLIEEKAKSGVFLSVLGFGGGNYQDATLELLADKGNGNYAYIDTLREAEKVLVEQMGGTLVTIAKDVKIQVEFNPAIAAAYRLIGYENRMLAKEDFNDDTKDAGEIGAGHTVTALYEIVPAGDEPELSDVDPLKYQLANPTPELIDNDELMTVKVRYKMPDEDTSTKLEHPVLDDGRSIDEASEDFRFAAAVASFGMILRNSNHRGDAIFDLVLDLADSASGQHRSEDREGFVELVEQARILTQSTD